MKLPRGGKISIRMDAEEKKKKSKDSSELKQDSESAVLKEKLEECEEKYRRALADYQNLEKRSRDQRGEYVRMANQEMLLRIIPILDTLMLAQKHDDSQTLAISISQFLDVLKAEGVVKIETLNADFDPHIMEAVEKVEDGDRVVEEVRTGYMLYDKLLRPAQVRVGK